MSLIWKHSVSFSHLSILLFAFPNQSTAAAESKKSRPSMPTLHLIIFKTAWYGIKSTAHWALLLPAEQVTPHCFGRVFDVQKPTLMSNETQYSNYHFTPEVRDNVDVYHSLNIEVETYTVNQICQRVSKDRHFDLVTRNCQHWVCEVIEQLVEDLNIQGGNEILIG